MKRSRKVLFIVGGIIGSLLLGLLGVVAFARIEYAFRTIEKKDGLVILHHPGRYDQSVDWYTEQYNNHNGTLIGLEVYNQGNRYPHDRETWDAINKLRTPYNYIWGFSSDDFHRMSHSFRNYQHFPLESLTEENLKNAMKTGAFYFSYEPDGANQSSPTYRQAATPRLTGVAIFEENITISGENFDGIMWYNDETKIIAYGTSLNTSLITSSFVRAVLNNTAGLSYTQPFGLYQGKIFNPYAMINWSTATHYKANFHTHTSRWEGELSPADTINHYHAANYSILALTEHSFNSWPWSSWIDNDPLTKSKTSEYYPDLGMLAISGNEVSGSHHFSSLFNNYAGAGLDLVWQMK
jgi:hypothetical protein